MDAETNSPDSSKQKAVNPNPNPSMPAREGNRPSSGGVEREHGARFFTIDERYAHLINERVEKEVAKNISAVVKEQLESLLKPITDLLHKSVSLRPNDDDLEKKIAAILKKQLEALPTNPTIPAPDPNSVTDKRVTTEQSPPQKAFQPGAPRIQKRLAKSIAQKTSHILPPVPYNAFARHLVIEVEDSDTDSLSGVNLISTTPLSIFRNIQKGRNSKKRAREDEQETQGAKKPASKAVLKKDEWAKSWREIYLGKHDSTPGKKPEDLTSLSLPSELRELIPLREKSNKQRYDNRWMNVRGVPTLCWMSQFQPRADWCRSDDIPTGNFASAVEARKVWWKNEWTDVSKECPQCTFRREKGEEDVACFFFSELDTVMMHVR